MKLVIPSDEFINQGGKQFHLYLWKWHKMRFQRFPSGAGIYSDVQTETLLAVELPTGERLRLELPPSRVLMPYFVAFRGFQPTKKIALIRVLRTAERLTDSVAVLSRVQLIERFGNVPVAPEDSYSSGQCWYGSKAWATKYFGKEAPPVRDLLNSLDIIPPIEVAAFIAASVYAAAYVIGDQQTRVLGVSEADIALSITEGRKADGSGFGRLSRLNADIHGRRRDGKAITTPAGISGKG